MQRASWLFVFAACCSKLTLRVVRWQWPIRDFRSSSVQFNPAKWTWFSVIQAKITSGLAAGRW